MRKDRITPSATSVVVPSPEQIAPANPPEAPSVLERPELSVQQRQLLRALFERDEVLGRIYAGGLAAFYDRGNPDQLALHAQAMREVMERLSRVLDVPAKDSHGSLKDRANKLQDQWDSACRNSKMLARPDRQHAADAPARRFFANLRSFFEWLTENHPRRRAAIAKTLDRLDPSGGSLPELLTKKNVDSWAATHGYFCRVAHHNIHPNKEEFGERMLGFESLLLVRFRPSTFDDFSAIDDLLGGNDD